ncbi:MAG: hypothetical protein RI955_1856 [Bacteroidota bacterium]
MKKIVTFILLQIPLFLLAQRNEPVKVFPGLHLIMDATHFNGKIYFKAVDSKNNTAWYVSEGDSLSTTKVYSLPYKLIVNTVSPQVLNNKLYFLSGRNSLISIDGITEKLDSFKIPIHASALTVFNNKLYFLGDTSIKNIYQTNHFLYEVDLEKKTFKPIYYFKNFVSNFHGAKRLLIYRDQLVIGAMDSTQTNEQLWISDGTAGGTKNITNVYIDYNHCSIFNFLFLNEFKKILYFNSYDTVNGCEPNYIDQSFDSVRVLKDIYKGGFCFNNYNIISASNFCNFKNEMYFLGVDSTNGSQLWKTDGTENGTRMIKKIINLKTDQNKSYSLNRQIFSNSDYLFVSPVRYDTIYGNELYIGKNDSFELFDLSPGQWSSNPQYFYLHNNHVYFVAHDWLDNYNLWVSDGTKVGTHQINKANSKVKSPLFYNMYNDIDFDNRFFSYNGSLYFEANYDSIGFGLYRLDDFDAPVKKVDSTLIEQMLCYPNPTKEILNIKFTTLATESCNLSLTDMYGRIIYTENFTSDAATNTKQINISKFAIGTYVVHLSYPNKSLKTKIEIYK